MFRFNQFFCKYLIINILIIFLKHISYCKIIINNVLVYLTHSHNLVKSNIFKINVGMYNEKTPHWKTNKYSHPVKIEYK